MNPPSLTLIDTLAALLIGSHARANERWFMPQTLQAGGTAELSLHLGEIFEGVQVGLSAPQTASLKHAGKEGNRELLALMPGQIRPSARQIF